MDPVASIVVQNNTHYFILTGEKHSDILLQDDDSLDNEFDKIFHPEKFDVSQLNPSDTGYVDEERKKYYR